MSNMLVNEDSPYLRQHAANPVDWYPWGAPALEKALRENRPIFLSSGYSACHWCHVMAHESFEDAQTAAFLNAHFVPIKLDREERPDLDAFYMRAVQLMTGQGGWPLSVFLTPDRKPFFGGTYFPKEPRYGAPAFLDVLAAVERAFREGPRGVETSAEQVCQALATSFAPGRDSAGHPPEATVSRTLGALLDRYDGEHGGFGRGPKFPQPALLEFLLLEGVRRGDADLLHAVRFTLERMAFGGVRDQLGGGFHRYSVDGQWRVPHYEKMLYDNAQLASLYALSHRATGDGAPPGVSLAILGDMLRTLLLPSGAFAASLDADSEGEEGRYYLWTIEEVRKVLGADADDFLRHYPLGQGRDGLEATTLRYEPPVGGGTPDSVKLRSCREKLLEARGRRIPPALDSKVLTDWNALAGKAFLDAFLAGGPEWTRDRGLALLGYLSERAWAGGLLHHLAGESAPRVPGFLADYAYLAEAEWTAYSATADPAHLLRCRDLLGAALDRFRDPASGEMYETPPDGSETLAIPRLDEGDGVLPSPLAVLARTLWRWERLAGDGWADAALQSILLREAGAAHSLAGSRPTLAGLALWRSLPGIDVVVSAPRREDFGPLLREALAPVHPQLLALPLLPPTRKGPGFGPAGLFSGRAKPPGEEAHLCSAGACSPPTSDPAAFRSHLQSVLGACEKIGARP